MCLWMCNLLLNIHLYGKLRTGWIDFVKKLEHSLLPVTLFLWGGGRMFLFKSGTTYEHGFREHIPFVSQESSVYEISMADFGVTWGNSFSV
jgi:hypothetical protein